MTAALRDEYPSCRILNHCIWPFDSGEVVVQPYNCMLTLSSLAEHSDGIVLTENEALTATCQQLLGTQRPGFADLNAVAARGLASVLLPCTQQQAPSIAAAPGAGGSAGMGGARGRGRPAWDSGGGGSGTTEPPPAAQQPEAAAWDGTFGGGDRWGADALSGSSGGGSGGGGRLDPLADVCERLGSRPGYRLLTLRCCPQMPASSFDFTPFSWPVVLKNLKQMQLTRKTVEAGLDWSCGGSGSGTPTAGGSSSGSGGGSVLGGTLGRGSAHRASFGSSSAGGGSACGQRYGSGAGLAGSGTGSRGGNKALASLLVLRGDQAMAADVACFGDSELFSSRRQQQCSPLAVAASNTRLAKQQMLATLLSNDQTPVAPVGRMLGKASQLFDARAYVHQYERYGLSCSDMREALGQVEDMLERYRDL